jgi:hypothetical protein
MRKLLLSALIVSVTSACVPVQKPVEWSAMGGSRSDATVKLQYSYTHGDPNPDISQAIHLAKSRCASWGYASAEVFGGQSKVCNGETKPGILGTPMCMGEWVVTKEFQCTGQGNAVQIPVNSPVAASDIDVSKSVPAKKHYKKRRKAR